MDSTVLDILEDEVKEASKTALVETEDVEEVLIEDPENDKVASEDLKDV